MSFLTTIFTTCGKDDGVKPKPFSSILRVTYSKYKISVFYIAFGTFVILNLFSNPFSSLSGGDGGDFATATTTSVVVGGGGENDVYLRGAEQQQPQQLPIPPDVPPMMEINHPPNVNGAEVTHNLGIQPPPPADYNNNNNPQPILMNMPEQPQPQPQPQQHDPEQQDNLLQNMDHLNPPPVVMPMPQSTMEQQQQPEENKAEPPPPPPLQPQPQPLHEQQQEPNLENNAEQQQPPPQQQPPQPQLNIDNQDPLQHPLPEHPPPPPPESQPQQQQQQEEMVAPPQQPPPPENPQPPPPSNPDPSQTIPNPEQPQPPPQPEPEPEPLRTSSSLRYLTLGSSVTWGSGMEVRFFAYPYLLPSSRSNLSNLAVRAAGPKYPSVCIQSMVSEVTANTLENPNQEYDVIVLEYYMRGYDGLYDLAQRLRTRYPDAILILLRLWMPVHIQYYQNNQLSGSFADWSLPKKLYLMSDELLKSLYNTNVDLRWEDPTYRNEVQNSVVRDFGAMLYEMDKPRDPKEALNKYRHLFAGDLNHLNEAGHRMVADAIRTIVDEKLNSSSSDSPYPEEPRFGTWGEGDACHSWYQSGQINLQYSLSASIEKYDARNDKYALSTGVNNPSGSGWIMVENPFHDSRNLILSYLATGPPPSMYPRTEIVVYPEGEEANVLSKVVLDPVTTDYEHKVHIVLTKKVAVIPPEENNKKIVVRWTPLEDTGKPFRLTATAVVGMGVEEGGILGAIKDFSFLE